MIKILLVVALCSIVVVKSKVEKTTVYLPPELTAHVNQSASACKVEGDDIPDYLKTIREGEYNDDPKFQRFIHCLCTSAGFADEKGKINVDKAVALFPEKETVTKLFNECNKQEGDSPQNTNYLVFKCFQVNGTYKVAFTRKPTAGEKH